MKYKLLLALLLLPILWLSSCTDRDQQYFQMSPMLKIIAIDPSGRPLAAANVILYDNEADYRNMTRPIRHGWTSMDGEIIFDGLYEKVYFFDVFDVQLRLDNSRGVYYNAYALRQNEMLVVPVRTSKY